jgi:chemotaxis protein MotA
MRVLMAIFTVSQTAGAGWRNLAAGAGFLARSEPARVEYKARATGPPHAAGTNVPTTESSKITGPGKRADLGLVTGLLIAFGAVVTGLAWSGAGLRYFLQPAGVVIVLGGTLGALLLTTPVRALFDALRRVRDLNSTPAAERAALVEEIVVCARLLRRQGLLESETAIRNASNGFLRDGLLLALDVQRRSELESALEIALRLGDRQAEADARVFEVAGGYAPTIGIIGTVAGLIEVLRHFSNLQAVGYGIGMAFVSTIYGLVLANLVLLPLAQRIRARAGESFQTQEMIAEGILGIFDQIHPSLLRLRLEPFLRTGERRRAEARVSSGVLAEEMR